MATSIKRPSLREIEIPSFGLKEVSDLDSLSYNSFEKAFHELENNTDEKHESNSKFKEGQVTQRESRKPTKNLSKNKLSFGEGLNVMLGLNDHKKSPKIIFNGQIGEPLFLKERFQLKTEQTVNMSRNSNAIKVTKPSFVAIKSSVHKESVIQRSSPIKPPQLRGPSFQRPTKDPPKTQTELSDAKISLQNKIYRFNQKSSGGKNLNCLPINSKCGYKTGKKFTVTKNKNFKEECNDIIESKGLINKIKSLIEVDKKQEDPCSKESSSTILNSQKMSSSLCKLEDQIGIIYSSIPINKNSKRKEVSSEKKNSYYQKPENYSFQENRRKTLGISASEGNNMIIDNKDKLQLVTPKKSFNTKGMNFEKKAKPCVEATPGKSKFRVFSKRTESHPFICSKVSIDKVTEKARHNLGSAKKPCFYSSYVAKLIRKTQSLNVFSESNTANRLDELSNNDTTHRVTVNDRDKVLEVLHKKINVLEKKLHTSMKKVKDLSEKHNKLSGVLITVVSDNINLKMQYKNDQASIANEGHPELIKAIKKTVSELVLTPERPIGIGQIHKNPPICSASNLQ